jgi:methylenetetrahydrofolate dehydrogenase (NADP+)/methenyltetrahydrofolate cyclohydrolase
MVIDGRALAQTILEELRKRVETLQEQKGIIPHLGIIRVGDDPATTSYVNQKERMGKRIGGLVSTYNYPQAVTQKELLESIHFLQTKGEIHGLIVQLPLPQHLPEETLIQAILPEKDVDGFLKNSPFVMPIAAAVMRILQEIHILEQGRQDFSRELSEFKAWLGTQKIVVMGKGKTGGKPIIDLFHTLHIAPLIIDSKTNNIAEITRSADILICAVGNRGTIITEGMIKNDAILIGIGMHLGADGKLHGDYEIDDIKDKAAYYTPIPGGVGPVNAAMLLVNVVQAAEQS